MARWAMELSQWDFEVRYRRGADNVIADTLSRQPYETCAAKKKESKDWYEKRYQAVLDDPTGNPEYCIRNNRLYRHILHTLDFNEYHQGEQWKICVPRADQQRVLTEVHNDPKAGHLGVAKTLVRLARHHYWPGMLRMGTQHVRNCDSCQKFKAQQQGPAGTMKEWSQ